MAAFARALALLLALACLLSAVGSVEAARALNWVAWRRPAVAYGGPVVVAAPVVVAPYYRPVAYRRVFWG